MFEVASNVLFASTAVQITVYKNVFLSRVVLNSGRKRERGETC